jgi:hypothetical protein
LSEDDFRVLSSHRRAVQEAIKAKIAQLREQEEADIRTRCAQEIDGEPFDWEGDWLVAGAQDAARSLGDESAETPLGR